VSNYLRVGVVLCLVALGLSIVPCSVVASADAENRVGSAACQSALSPPSAPEAPAGSGCAGSYPYPCLCSIACPGGQPAGGPNLTPVQSVQRHLVNQVSDPLPTLKGHSIFHPPRHASVG
jgi:hypothetical protein